MTKEEQKYIDGLVKAGKHAGKVLKKFTDHLNEESKKSKDFWKWFDEHERNLGNATRRKY